MKDFIINWLIAIIKFALIVGMVYLMYYIEGSSPTKESFAISIGGTALLLTLLHETKQERGKL